MNDTFNGDNASLIENIDALLRLDAAGALFPHGVGGLARQLLSAAAMRLAAAPPQPYCAPDGTCSCQKFADDPATCERRVEAAAPVLQDAQGRKAFARYMEDCDKCAIVPDVAGAFHWAWTHAAPVQKDLVGDIAALNDDLIAILGRPNFTCIRLAQALRLCGVEIETKAEHEQAAVIHFLLMRYLSHGSDWAKHADADLRAMLDQAEAKNKAAAQSGPAATPVETKGSAQ